MAATDYEKMLHSLNYSYDPLNCNEEDVRAWVGENAFTLGEDEREKLISEFLPSFEAPKKKGRPVGSKNKPKEEVEIVESAESV